MLERVKELIGVLGARVIKWTLACASCKMNLHRFLRRVPDMRYLLVNGPERYVVDTRDTVIGRELFVRGHFEFDKFETALHILKKAGSAPRDLLIDAGANIGSVCIPAVRRGYFRRAIAIEPNPASLMLLRCNLLLNELVDKITVLDRALSDAGGQRLLLQVSDNNHGDNRISQERKPNSIEVQGITLDEIAESHPSSEMLVWMDLQGYEGVALRGFKTGLLRTPPLVIEFWPDAMARNNTYAGLKEAIGHYSTFVDLRAPGIARSIGDMDALFSEVKSSSSGYTDIVLVQ